MTFLQLKERTFQRIGESSASPVWWTSGMVDAALNEAQDIFVLMTLCLEKLTVFTISSGANFVTPMTTAADWLCPLRVRLYNGAKLTPAKIEDFHAEAWDWQAERAAPRKYAAAGCNLLALYPVPSTSFSIEVIHAYSPTRLTDNSDTPEIPEEDHPALEEYAVWRCLLKAGGADLSAAAPRLRAFLETIQTRAAQVRARNVASGYDRQPSEVTQADISRIVKEATSGPAGSRQRRSDPVVTLG